MTTQTAKPQTAEPRSTEEEIRETRRNIDEKVRRIQDRLSPGDVVGSVTDFLATNGGAIASGVGRSVRDNPVPAALIGTGIAWLALSSLNRRRTGTEGDAGSDTGEGLRHKAAAVKDNLGQRASHMAERADELKQGALRQVKNAGSAGGDFVKEHPLLVGAAGIVLGAAVAASLPRWQREDQVYGERSDQMKSAAKRAAREQAQKVQNSAKAAVDKARRKAEERSAAASAKAN